MIKTLRNKRKGKHKRAHSNELETLVSSPPSFPGVRLHVLTEDASENEIEQLSPVKHFPVIIHKLDRKNSVITTFDELKQHRKLKSQKSSPSWVIGKKIELKKENSEHNEIIIEEVEDEVDMIPIPTSGCVSVQGERTHMEDRFVEYAKFHISFPQISTFGKHISYFGVYDGHAGARVADFCVEKLHKIIVNQMEEDEGKDGNIADFIDKGLVSADQEIVELSGGTWKDGSCISILMMVDNILYTANLGDSHMVLCEIVQNKPRPILLTKAHKATEEEEKSRILSQGGMVMKGRVFGDLMISRALGDLDYKKPKQEENFISNIPHKDRHILKSRRHPFAILASDGLWDKISYQESVEMIEQEKHSKNPHELSKMLVDEAAKRGSMDNTTAMVVIFNWKPKDELNDDSKDEENGDNIIIIKENGSDSKNSEQIELDNT